MYTFLDDKGYLYYISIFEKEKQRYYTIYRKLDNPNNIGEPKRWETKKNKLCKTVREAQTILIEQALKNGWQKVKNKWGDNIFANIDKAITKCREKAYSCSWCFEYERCSEEFFQIADWLEELKQRNLEHKHFLDSIEYP